MSIIRRPAVAGKFYPYAARQLTDDVQQMLGAVDVVAGRPKILIAPHAGYVYSGPIAAAAFATLKSHRDAIHRVVILGTCHTSSAPNIFTVGADSFETPLGEIQIDKRSIELAIEQGAAVIDDHAHQFDHAIEVQLPFLQLALNEFNIVPFLVSTAPT